MYRFKTEDIQLRCFIFSKQSHRVQAIYRIPSSIATLTGNVCSFLQKLEDLSNNTPKHFLSFWPRKRSAEIQPHSGPSHRITDQKETHFKEWLPQSRAVLTCGPVTFLLSIILLVVSMYMGIIYICIIYIKYPFAACFSYDSVLSHQHSWCSRILF